MSLKRASVGHRPSCPACGTGFAVILCRTGKGGLWQCWDWQCRHIWTTRSRPNTEKDPKQ
jgi:hypothetical protein